MRKIILCEGPAANVASMTKNINITSFEASCTYALYDNDRWKRILNWGKNIQKFNSKVIQT